MNDTIAQYTNNNTSTVLHNQVGLVICLIPDCKLNSENTNTTMVDDINATSKDKISIPLIVGLVVGILCGVILLLISMILVIYIR